MDTASSVYNVHSTEQFYSLPITWTVQVTRLHISLDILFCGFKNVVLRKLQFYYKFSRVDGITEVRYLQWAALIIRTQWYSEIHILLCICSNSGNKGFVVFLWFSTLTLVAKNITFVYLISVTNYLCYHSENSYSSFQLHV